MTDPTSTKNLIAFQKVLNEELGRLKLHSSSYYEVFGAAARRFLKNRELDIAPTDASILRELKKAIGRPASKLARHMLDLSDEVTDVLFGEFPGHTDILETWEDESTKIHLPDHGELLGDAMKSLWRRNLAPGARGVLKLKRSPHIAECLPRDMSTGRLAGTLAALVDLIVALTPDEATRRDRLFGFGLVLVEGAGQADASFTEGGVAALEEAVADGVLAAHLKASLPHIAAKYGALSDLPEERGARSFCVATFAALAADADRKSRRGIIKVLAELFPEEFHAQLIDLEERVRAQYQAENSGRGSQRSAHRWMFAHASWILIRDVMDVVWPPENGTLNDDSLKLILTICEAVLIYADPSISNGTNLHMSRRDGKQRAVGDTGTLRRANFSISADHAKTIASLRSSIFMLDEMLFQMERNLADMERAKVRDGFRASREEVDLRQRIEALQSWRREAQRRLSQGDWEKGRKAAAKKRITGSRVAIPEFSFGLKRMRMADRIVKASDLALRIGLGPAVRS